jgi:site-specific recombinase XerD
MLVLGSDGGLRALTIVLWRTGLRISEVLALEERDLRRSELAVMVRPQ